MRYNHFDMLPDRAFMKVGGRITLEGGGGGGQQGPTTSTTQTSNIPEYARPYVETMMGAAQQQVYNMDSSGNVTGIKPYVPYSQNPADYVAPFSPLQQQAQGAAANLQTPGQYGQATGIAGGAAMGSFGAANQAARAGQQYAQQATNPYAVQAYMNPYLQASLAPQLQQLAQQTGIKSAAEQGAATSAGAFGGSRQALQSALNKQAGNLAAQQAIGQGYNQAYQQALQAQQFGANLGLQGQQAAIQGYGQAGNQAQNLANIGTQQLAADTSIIGTQAAQGALQQQNQQNIINQAIQNYAMAQQYPQQQLGFLSSLLHGLPLQGTITSGYQAAPSLTSQLSGLGTAGLAAYNLTKKKGGVIKETDGIDKLALYDTMRGAK